MISEHLGCPACVRRASCVSDGCHSWSFTNLLGGNSNRKVGRHMFVARACLISSPLVPWTSGVRIPIRLGGVGVLRYFVLPLVMWRCVIPLLDMVLSRYLLKLHGTHT